MNVRMIRGKYLLPLSLVTLFLALCLPQICSAQDATGRPSSSAGRKKPGAKPVVPQAMTVILTILTDPPGCQVLINGEPKGKTNAEGKLVFPKLPVAHYDVEARKDGFSSVKKGFQAGSESPTLVFKLKASLDDQVSQFNQLVAAGKLIGPESPNAFDVFTSLSASHPDREEVAKMRAALLPKLVEPADAAVNSTLLKWRTVSRSEIELGQTFSECVAKLQSDDSRAAARPAYLKGILAMRDWLSGSQSNATTQTETTQNKAQADQLAAARESLAKALQLDGTWAAPSYQLGRLLLFSGSAEDAQASFVKATQLEPNWAAAHIGLADAYYAAGKRKEAIGEYQRAVKLDPASARAYAGLGLARWSNGEARDGLKDIERAAQLDPSSGLPHLNLAIVYGQSKKKKDRDKAIEEIDEALKKNPDNLEFRSDVAARIVGDIKGRDGK